MGNGDSYFILYPEAVGQPGVGHEPTWGNGLADRAKKPAAGLGCSSSGLQAVGQDVPGDGVWRCWKLGLSQGEEAAEAFPDIGNL